MEPIWVLYGPYMALLFLSDFAARVWAPGAAHMEPIWEAWGLPPLPYRSPGAYPPYHIGGLGGSLAYHGLLGASQAS